MKTSIGIHSEISNQRSPTAASVDKEEDDPDMEDVDTKDPNQPVDIYPKLMLTKMEMKRRRFQRSITSFTMVQPRGAHPRMQMNIFSMQHQSKSKHC
jgi:hypothetical protein